MQLAEVLGATLQDVQDLETGIASPSVERLRLLTERFGVSRPLSTWSRTDHRHSVSRWRMRWSRGDQRSRAPVRTVGRYRMNHQDPRMSVHRQCSRGTGVLVVGAGDAPLPGVSRTPVR